MSKTRGRAQRIEIRAPIEDVWKAITEADEIIRWYAPEAEVSLSEGGRYWVSWGEGTAGTSRIESFERNRHLRLVHEGEGPAQLDEPMVEEYFLESMARSRCCASFSQASRQRPIGTISTKIPVAAGRFFLPGSGIYVERHFGQPCENMDHEGKIPRSKAESAIHVIHPT